MTDRYLEVSQTPWGNALISTLGLPRPPRLLAYDASGIARPEQLRELYDFFQPLAARFPGNGRVVVIGRPVDDAKTASQAAAQGALLGFTKSLAKEIGRKGSTANYIEV